MSKTNADRYPGDEEISDKLYGMDYSQAVSYTHLDVYKRQYQHLYGDNPENDLTSDEFKQQVENTEYGVLLACLLYTSRCV